MPRRGWLIALLLVVAAAAPLPAAATCKLRVAEMAVTMSELRPMVHAQINGTDTLFIADSGAFYSMLTRGTAAEFKLPLASLPFGFMLRGVGGEAQGWLTHVSTFTLLDVPLHNTEFIVVGNELGAGAAGVLGQDVFRIFGDVEYDLANGLIRIVKTKDCRDSPLAYWAKAQPYSAIEIDHATPASPHTTSVAFLNGTKIRVMFDTGAATSVLTLEAAKRAGITPNSEGVVPAGESYGIGRRVVKTWIAPFPSFRIGDEEVRNTHLRFGAGTMLNVDMLIGADFFLSHRVYVANSQHKLYFTYNGGPVFNLTARPAVANNSLAPAGTATTDATAQTRAPAAASADQPADASGFARRGAAFAARRDFERAIADLTRACELAPAEANYFYQRGLAHWGNRQPDLAMADLNQALKLKPDNLAARVARADLHVTRQEIPAAVADLDAAERAAPKEADVRIRMADLYLLAGEFASAALQVTLWIDAHGWDNVQMPRARFLRCRARALSGEELDKALNDCDAAVKLKPNTAAFLESRALVQLRRGEYDKAMADYDRALSLGSKDPWTYYGRGLARLRKGMTAQGQADLTAAGALRPKIAEEAARRGISP
jgi:tetratricopeptide (TPR) repeat protein/predicted aspartyl protease